MMVVLDGFYNNNIIQLWQDVIVAFDRQIMFINSRDILELTREMNILQMHNDEARILF